MCHSITHELHHRLMICLRARKLLRSFCGAELKKYTRMCVVCNRYDVPSNQRLQAERFNFFQLTPLACDSSLPLHGIILLYIMNWKDSRIFMRYMPDYVCCGCGVGNLESYQHITFHAHLSFGIRQMDVCEFFISCATGRHKHSYVQTQHVLCAINYLINNGVHHIN